MTNRERNKMRQSLTASEPQLSLVTSDGELLAPLPPQPVEPDPEPAVSFDDFWLLYPRHVAKKDARRAWAKIDVRQHITILIALVAWRPVWRTKDEEVIPHPATWLNGERWEDELPAGYRQRPSDPPRVAELLPAGPRTAIPEHVRALMAKLRGAK